MEVLTKIGLGQEDRSSRNSSTGGKFENWISICFIRKTLVDLNYTRGKILFFL